MNDLLVPAVAGGVTAFLVTLLTQYLIYWFGEKAKKRDKREALLREYLNPLRLSLVEVHSRLKDINKRVHSIDENTKKILSEIKVNDISAKDVDWFNGTGYYLTSSCYLTAVLFCRMYRLREDWPYIRLDDTNDDTQLAGLILRVSRGFSQGLGVFHVTQPSIGTDLYLDEKKRLMTYREYCELLQKSEKRIWCDRLLSFFIETGSGEEEKLKRMDTTLAALEELGKFLDRVVGGRQSISDELE